MKFQASNENILPAITLASRFIGKQNNLPVLSAVLMSTDTDSVILRATNLECGVEVSFPATISEGGTAALSGVVLAGFLQNAHARSVSIASQGEVVKVDTERSKATIKTLQSDDFPTLPRVSAEQSFTIKSGDFVKLLRAVVHCAATSGVKPELQSVYLTGEAGKITAAATDSFRLAEKTVALKSRGGVPPILLPARNTSELIRILDGFSGDVEVYYSQNQISVQVESVYYTSRLIDGAFPNYRQIIPKEFTTEAILLREDFNQSLRSLSLFTDKFLQITFLSDPKRKIVELSSRNADVGEEVITLKAAVSGEGIQMNFNSRYLADATVPINGESLRLRMQGPGKPLVVTDAADDSYLYLAMPMNR